MADIQRIIIEIAADVTELQPAVDKLRNWAK